MLLAALFAASLAAAPAAHRLELETGPRVQLIVKRPAADRPGRMPALLVLGGLETGAKALDLLAPDRDVVLATFEYPYDGPRRFRFPRTLTDAPRIKEAVRVMADRVVEARRLLSARPDVDPERVCVVGASFGAPFAVRAAARDEGLRCLILVHGFADVEATAASRMRQLWARDLGPAAGPSAWLLSRLLVFYLDPPAPEHEARSLRAGLRVLVLEAQADTVIPPSSRELLWRSVSGSKAAAERVLLPGDHLNGARDAALRAVMSAVSSWLGP